MTRRRKISSRRAQRLVAGFGAGGSVLAVPAIASAHIEPDPPVVEAGTDAVVGFVVEHGCEGSPTIELRFQVPSGVSNAEPVDKDGWATSVAGDVVTFTGGSLASQVSDRFEIRFTAPAAAGTIAFPVVQRCDEGELAWIEVPSDGQPDPGSPAPTIDVTGGPPSEEDVGAASRDDGEHEHHSEEVPDQTDTVSADDDGVSGGLIGAGVGAAVIVGTTGLLVRRRRDTTG